MLLDIEDDPVWHSAEEEHEDAGETSNYSVGQECLDRLSISLGGNTIVPVASELLPAYLAAPEWQKTPCCPHCPCSNCRGLLQGYDGQLLMHWTVVTDLGPELQVKYHQRLLPALAAAMDDFQNPRVQAHAASAVLNFSENCTPDILTPYLDGIVSKLLVLLQNGKQMVQEGALTALASVHFQKYYDAVMPYLKAILVNANDKSNRMLRAKSMECISLVGMAVGKEKFRDDAKQDVSSFLIFVIDRDEMVMDVLMSLQGSQMEADDPTTSYMLQLKPDVTITSADSDADIYDSDDDSIETITLGDKRIGIKTSVLEERPQLATCYVAPTLVPLLIYFHEEVRKAAVSGSNLTIVVVFVLLTIQFCGEGQSQGRNESYIKQLSDYIIPALVDALHKEPETEICASMLDSLNECIQISGPLLDEGQVRSIVDEIKQVITASSSRKRERAERAKAEDFDAEEGELLKKKMSKKKAL
ncbi:Importin-5 [Vitis vinifera]|uniref:Importin-5 n=1 Tax=Vitis vinifera TaxID=29760 RepID=A0A438EGU0_VITVI|nr:Importin-5 [Vitis vinifera]